MAIDLSLVEGVSEEQAAAILALHEADIGGLKAKNAELIQREQAAKSRAEEIEAARIAAEEQAKIELAEKEKDFDGLKAALAERDARIAEEAKRIAEMTNAQLMGAAKNDFMQHVIDDPAAKNYLDSIFEKGVGVRDGKIVPVNAEGGVTGQSLNEFISGIKSNPDFAKYIVSQSGSGGSAAGSSATGGTADLSKMSKTELTLYLNKNPDAAAQVFKLNR